MPTILQAVESALDQMNNAKRDFDDERGRVQKDLQDVSLEVKVLQEEFDDKVKAKLDPVADGLQRQINGLSEKLAQTQQALDEALKKIEQVSSRASQAQNTANTANSAVDNLRSDIQNGGIIAQKALMLRGRNDNHWMRFQVVTSTGLDLFMMYRIPEGDFLNNIKVPFSGAFRE